MAIERTTPPRRAVVIRPGEVDFTDVPDLPFDFTVEVDVGPDGQAVVTRLEARATIDAPISQRSMAESVGRVRRAAVEALTVAARRDHRGRLVPVGQPGWPMAGIPRSDEVDEILRPGARASVAGAELEGVAEVYRRAVADGVPTTAAVAEAFGIGPACARKRIERARVRGLLEPAGGTTRPNGGSNRGSNGSHT